MIWERELTYLLASLFSHALPVPLFPLSPAPLCPCPLSPCLCVPVPCCLVSPVPLCPVPLCPLSSCVPVPWCPLSLVLCPVPCPLMSAVSRPVVPCLLLSTSSCVLCLVTFHAGVFAVKLCRLLSFNFLSPVVYRSLSLVLSCPLSPRSPCISVSYVCSACLHAAYSVFLFSDRHTARLSWPRSLAWTTRLHLSQGRRDTFYPHLAWAHLFPVYCQSRYPFGLLVMRWPVPRACPPSIPRCLAVTIVSPAPC